MSAPPSLRPWNDRVTASNVAWEGGVLRAFSSSSSPYFHARYFLIHFAEIRRNLDVGVQGLLFSTRIKFQERGCLVVEMRPALMMPLVKTYDNIGPAEKTELQIRIVELTDDVVVISVRFPLR